VRNLRIIVFTLVGLGCTVVLLLGMVVLLLSDGDLRTIFRQLALIGREDGLSQTVSRDDSPVRFTVNSGETPTQIAQKLLQTNLILDAELFVDYVRAEGLDRQLEAGTYFLNRAQTIPEIALALTDSRFSQITFTVIPGWRLEQVLEAIDANPLFAFDGAAFYQVIGPGAVIDPAFAQRVGLPEGASLEGFLFPNTYQLAPEITPEGLRETLLNAFLSAVEGEIETTAATQGYSLYQIVTMASIVQREAIHIDEQPKIAGVYFNRLNIGMRLDADPTVQYALGNSRGTWWARITLDDYQGVISDYNTYRVTGLPPGPIASPGISAIRATVTPEASDYFYFRADCRADGYHDFARTYEEHLQNGC
jgi:UPF0755 protein